MVECMCVALARKEVINWQQQRLPMQSWRCPMEPVCVLVTK
jgi:hypothetical protein